MFQKLPSFAEYYKAKYLSNQRPVGEQLVQGFQSAIQWGASSLGLTSAGLVNQGLHKPVQYFSGQQYDKQGYERGFIDKAINVGSNSFASVLRGDQLSKAFASSSFVGQVLAKNLGFNNGQIDNVSQFATQFLKKEDIVKSSKIYSYSGSMLGSTAASMISLFYLLPKQTQQYLIGLAKRTYQQWKPLIFEGFGSVRMKGKKILRSIFKQTKLAPVIQIDPNEGVWIGKLALANSLQFQLETLAYSNIYIAILSNNKLFVLNTDGIYENKPLYIEQRQIKYKDEYFWQFIGPSIRDIQEIIQNSKHTQILLDMSNINRFMPNIALYATDRMDIKTALAPFLVKNKIKRKMIKS